MLPRPMSPVAGIASESGPTKQKKTLVRRRLRDRSQQVRRTVQFAFLALNAWLAIEFLRWPHYFGEPGSGSLCGTASRTGWLASHRRPDVPEVFSGDPSFAGDPSGGDGACGCISAVEPTAEKDVLLVALSGGHHLGVSLKAWPQAVSPQRRGATVARHSAAQPKIRADGFLPLHRRQHDGRGVE